MTLTDTHTNIATGQTQERLLYFADWIGLEVKLAVSNMGKETKEDGWRENGIRGGGWRRHDIYKEKGGYREFEGRHIIEVEAAHGGGGGRNISSHNNVVILHIVKAEESWNKYYAELQRKPLIVKLVH